MKQPIPAKEVPVEEKPVQEMPPQPSLTRLRPAVPLWPFKKLLGYSWKYYKPLILKIWPLIGFLFIISVIRTLYELFFPTPASPQDLTEIVIPTLLGVLSAIINMAFMGFVIPVVSFILLHSFYEQSAESLKGALKKVMPLAMPYTIVVLFAGLVMFGGYILFIIPGVILGIWLSFTTVVLVVENRRGFEVLLRSTGLVLGYSWDIFLRFIGVGLIGTITSFLLNLPVFIVSLIAMLPFYRIMGQDPTAVEELTSGQLPFYLRAVTSFGSLWSNLITLLILPFGVAFAYLLYRNLKQIKGEVVAYEKKKLFTGFMILGAVAIIITLIVVLGALTIGFMKIYQP